MQDCDKIGVSDVLNSLIQIKFLLCSSLFLVMIHRNPVLDKTGEKKSLALLLQLPLWKSTCLDYSIFLKCESTGHQDLVTQKVTVLQVIQGKILLRHCPQI